MDYKRLLQLATIALLASYTFPACQKDEPKKSDTEKTDDTKKDTNPHTDGSTGATTSPTPKPPVIPTKPTPDEQLPALREGEVRVAVPEAGGLKDALKGQDLSKVHILLLTYGAIDQSDCDFIRTQLKALEELDISRVAWGIADDEKGLKDNKTIKKLIAPATLRRTTDGWFSYTRAEELIFPGDKLRIFGGALFNERARRITLPESVETILSGAFWNNHKMESVHLPSKLKVIPSRCFYFCKSLQTIEIPASVTELQSEAFGMCVSLKTITFLGDAPALQTDDKRQLLSPFASVVWEQEGKRHCVIRVPKGKTQSFLEKWQWSADKASRFEEY